MPSLTTFTFGERTLRNTCSIGHRGPQFHVPFFPGSPPDRTRASRFLAWFRLKPTKIGFSGSNFTEKAVFLPPTPPCRVPGRRITVSQAPIGRSHSGTREGAESRWCLWHLDF